MHYLNLDSQFQPYGTGLTFEAFTFNGGEPHLRITESFNHKDEVIITARPQSFNAFGNILLAADALQRIGVRELSLHIPYFPAARQDRIMVPGEPLTVKIYADILNQIGFKEVVVFDPHSDVTTSLLNNVRAVSNHAFVKEVVKNFNDYILISPDGGALKKIYKLSQQIGASKVVECSKMRDVKTGKLSGFSVYAEDLEQRTCIIVDDIIDGGGTFLGLAEELKKKNAGDLILVASHGIFSHGYDELLTTFKGIYTTNSFKDIDKQGVMVSELNKILMS